MKFNFKLFSGFLVLLFSGLVIQNLYFEKVDWTYLQANSLKNNKVTVCHNGKTIEVSENAVDALLANNPENHLGPCIEPTAAVGPVFQCDEKIYLSQGPSGANVTLNQVAVSESLSLTPMGEESDIKYNAIGYRVQDNYLYGIDTTNKKVIRLYSDGTFEDLGDTPDGISSISGDVGADGFLYVSANSKLYKIDVTTSPASVASGYPKSLTSGVGPDMAWNDIDNQLYTVSGEVRRIDPATGVVTNVSDIYHTKPNNKKLSIGAGYTDSRGNFYGYVNKDYTDENGNAAGALFRFDINTGEKSFVSFGPAVSTNDGASCRGKPPVPVVSDLTIQTTTDASDPKVSDVITVITTVTNNGPFDNTGITAEISVGNGYSANGTNPSQGSLNSDVWTVGDLASGESATMELTLNILASGSYAIAAQITAADETDPDTSNDQNTLTLSPGSEPIYDVWIKDPAPDDGSEPSLAKKIWRSPDIWARNQDDGIQKHQDIIPGQDNYVYVRIHNRGNQVLTDSEISLYYVKPRLGRAWPRAWTQIESAKVVNVLNVGEESIVTFLWDKDFIPAPGHYCFHVRVENEEDPIPANASTNNAVQNTKNSNNVAWRNFNVVGFKNKVKHQTTVTVENSEESNAMIELVVEEADELLGKNGAEMIIDLKELFIPWQTAGGNMVNVELVEDTKIRITGNPARIQGIPMTAVQEVDIDLEIKITEPLPGPGEEQTFNISLQEFIDGSEAGGVDFSMTARAQGTDTDGDEIPDVTDPDDDNDGWPDVTELANDTNPLDASSPGSEPLVDIWIADPLPDDGSEPTLAKKIWRSPDIWARNTDDGVEKHQDVIPNQDNYVYVRVRNRGDIAMEDIRVSLDRTDPTLGRAWPKGWAHIGDTVVDRIEAGEEKVVKILWAGDDIPRPGHYCFHVRIENDLDLIPESATTTNAVKNTKNSNNVAWRNFNVVGMKKKVTHRTSIQVENSELTDASIDLVIEEEDQLLGKHGTDLIVDLKELFSPWQTAGGAQTNIELLEGTKIRIIGDPAKVLGIPMTAEQEVDIDIEIKVTEPLPGAGIEQEFNVSLQSFIDEEEAGGVDFVLTARAQGADSDADNIPDIIDPDDDNDGWSDVQELANGTNPLDASEPAQNPVYDLWIKDPAPDDGSEPSLAKKIWRSPDIWARNEDDMGTKHQDIIPGQDNYVYVRFRNIGNHRLDDSEVSLYYVKPRLGRAWPRAWTPIEGVKLVERIDAGEETIVKFKWAKDFIPAPGHYCFHVRIENALDPIPAEASTNNAVQNTKNSNNIAWRNFNVVGMKNKVRHSTTVTVENSEEKEAVIDLIVEEEDDLLGKDGTNLIIDLKELFSPWQTAGADQTNIEVLEDTKVRITSSPAKITGIPMTAAQEVDIEIEIQVFEPLPGAGNEQTFNISLQELIDGTEAGGVDFEMTARAQESDTDEDGTPDVSDLDDDNDRASDAWEIESGFNPVDATDKEQHLEGLKTVPVCSFRVESFATIIKTEMVDVQNVVDQLNANDLNYIGTCAVLADEDLVTLRSDSVTIENSEDATTFSPLKNDTFQLGLDLNTVKIIEAPASGKLEVIDTGEFVYQPEFGFSGIDKFSYEACDYDGNCATGVVHIAVLAPATATITGLVWSDENYNGLRDSAEALDSDVEIQLLSSDGSLVLATKTQANGSYTIAGIAPGDYRLAAIMPERRTVTVFSKEGSVFDLENRMTDILTLKGDEKVSGLQVGLVPDTDEDWIPDFVEGVSDFDGDGVLNYRDLDSDNDGITDHQELRQTENGAYAGAFLDQDSDDDGVSDTIEAGGKDTDFDGVVDGFSDSANRNGLDDATEVQPLYLSDTDKDGLASHEDFDNDGDGFSDFAETHPGKDYAPSGKDRDGDGIDDTFDVDYGAVLPTLNDRDKDGVYDFQDIDPAGYFYDAATGKILTGGKVSVTGPGSINLVSNAFDTGFYQFFVGSPGVYKILPQAPLGYRLSTQCKQEKGPFDPTGLPDPFLMGSDQDTLTGFLVDPGCSANPFYLDFDLDAGDPFILQNNIPFDLIEPITAAGTTKTRQYYPKVEVVSENFNNDRTYFVDAENPFVCEFRAKDPKNAAGLNLESAYLKVNGKGVQVTAQNTRFYPESDLVQSTQVALHTTMKNFSAGDRVSIECGIIDSKGRRSGLITESVTWGQVENMTMYNSRRAQAIQKVNQIALDRSEGRQIIHKDLLGENWLSSAPKKSISKTVASEPEPVDLKRHFLMPTVNRYFVLARMVDDLDRLEVLPKTAITISQQLAFQAGSIFPQIDVNEEAYSALVNLYLQGVVSESESLTLDLKAPVTRAQGVDWLLATLEMNPSPAEVNSFTDLDSDAEILAGATLLLETNLDYVAADAGAFAPSEALTYKAFAQWLVALGALESNPLELSLEQLHTVLESHNLLPNSVSSETVFLTQGAVLEMLHRFTVLKDLEISRVESQMRLNIAAGDIVDLPVYRTLLSEASVWMAALNKGAGFYEDRLSNGEKRMIIFAHSSAWSWDENPFGTIFAALRDKNRALLGTEISLSRFENEIEDYKIVEVKRVHESEVAALKHLSESIDLVLFTCDIDTDYRWVFYASSGLSEN